MTNDFQAMNNEFFALVENFDDDDALCEIEGHHDVDSSISHFHDDGGAQWQSIFMCPNCGDILTALMCDQFRNSMVSWIEAGVRSTSPFFTCDCGRESDLYEAYVRSVKWG